MQFFDDTKNFGVLATIVGVTVAVAGIVAGIQGLIFTMVGGILSGAVIALSGYTIFSGMEFGPIGKLFPEGKRNKYGVVIGYSAAVGVATIIDGIFGIFDSVGYGIGGVAVGILILGIVWIVSSERKTAADKIIWILLVVFFFFAMILAIIEICKGGIYLATGITLMLSYLVAFKYLFDDNVKNRF